MTTSDLFGLALRLLGLWVLWTTLSSVLGMVLGPASFGFGIFLLLAVQFFLGLWLLRGARQLQEFAYPVATDGST